MALPRPLARLTRRDPDKPTLRERFADLRARLPGAPKPDVGDRPATLEDYAGTEFEAYAFDQPVKDPTGWAQTFADHALAMHLADRTLRMTKPELVAFIVRAGERDAIVPETILKALDAAQETFEGWGKLLDLARTRYVCAASADLVADEARRATA